MAETLDRLGLKFLGNVAEGFIGVVATEKPENHAAVGPKGIHIRVWSSKVAKDTTEAIGFKTTTMNWAEVFAAVQLGAVDGAICCTPQATYTVFAQSDVGRYFIPYNAFVEASTYYASKRTWEKLNDEQRAAVQAAVDRAAMSFTDWAQANDGGYVARIRDAGWEVLDFYRGRAGRDRRSYRDDGLAVRRGAGRQGRRRPAAQRPVACPRCGRWTLRGIHRPLLREDGQGKPSPSRSGCAQGPGRRVDGPMTQIVEHVPAALRRPVRLLLAVNGAFICAASLTMAATFFCVVVLRYGFGADLFAYEEWLLIICFWLYFMASAVGTYENSHVSADLMDLSDGGRAALGGCAPVLVGAIELVVSLAALYWAVLAIGDEIASYPYWQTTIALKIPFLVPRLAPIVGFGLMAFYTALRLYVLFKLRRVPESGAAGAGDGDAGSVPARDG